MRRRIRETGRRNFKAFRKCALTEISRRRRLHFCKKWSKESFQNVIFTDEKRFCFAPDARRQVWCLPSERLKKPHIHCRFAHGGGGIMVWGAITINGVGPLKLLVGRVDGRKYTSVLSTVFNKFPNLRNYSNRSKCKQLWQQDNAPVHTCKRARKFFSQHGVCPIIWPASSPDLNVIENVWSILQRRVRLHRAQNNNELWKAVKQEWKRIDVGLIRRLYGSLPTRLEHIIKSRGWYSKW